MALARCADCGIPDGRTKTYSRTFYYPSGYPGDGVICARPDGRKSALVWLTPDEESAYERGERIFSIPSQGAKLKVR